MKEENELCEEPEEIKEEGETGITARIAKDVEDAKENPPEEGVWGLRIKKIILKILRGLESKGVMTLGMFFVKFLKEMFSFRKIVVSKYTFWWNKKDLYLGAS